MQGFQFVISTFKSARWQPEQLARPDLLMKHFLIFAVVLLTSCARPEQMFLLTSHDGSFQVEFPGKPELKQETSIAEYGKQNFTIYVYNAVSSHDDNLIYYAGSTKYPDSIMEYYDDNLDAFFNYSMQNSVRSVHGQLISQKVIEYKGIPGRAIRIDFKNGVAVFTMRIYLKANTAYFLQTITETQKDFNKSQTRFFDSFKIIDE